MGSVTGTLIFPISEGVLFIHRERCQRHTYIHDGDANHRSIYLSIYLHPMRPLATIAAQRPILDTPTQKKLDIWTSTFGLSSGFDLPQSGYTYCFLFDDIIRHQPLERISVSRKARRVSRRRCKVSFQNTQPFTLQEEQYFFPLGGEATRKQDQISARGMRGERWIFFFSLGLTLYGADG